MTDKNAFTGLYVGEKIAKGLGGYVFQFFVPYEDADNARSILGGSWKPDSPVNVGIVPVNLQRVDAP